MPARGQDVEATGFDRVDRLLWVFALGRHDLVTRKPRNLARTVCLVRHLGAIPPELREQFLDGVMEWVGAAGGDPLVLGCVRLNLVARLPDASRWGTRPAAAGSSPAGFTGGSRPSHPGERS